LVLLSLLPERTVQNGSEASKPGMEREAAEELAESFRSHFLAEFG
jgi:hypothetical protein